MATLAEQIGQIFEAKAFLTVAVENEPNRPELRGNLARLRKAGQTDVQAHRTVAECVGLEL
jgi:hypothetical protein